MTSSESQELIDFLSRKFDRIDSRFGGLEERLTRVEVSVEQNRALIQTVAEGVSTVDAKLERFRGEVAEEFRAVRLEMAAGLSSVRQELA